MSITTKLYLKVILNILIELKFLKIKEAPEQINDAIYRVWAYKLWQPQYTNEVDTFWCISSNTKIISNSLIVFLVLTICIFDCQWIIDKFFML